MASTRWPYRAMPSGSRWWFDPRISHSHFIPESTGTLSSPSEPSRPKGCLLKRFSDRGEPRFLVLCSRFEVKLIGAPSPCPLNLRPLWVERLQAPRLNHQPTTVDSAFLPGLRPRFRPMSGTSEAGSFSPNRDSLL